MELLSTLLRGLPEYPRLLEAARSGKSAAVYGVSSIHRAHLAASLLAGPVRVFAMGASLSRSGWSPRR